MANTKQDKGVNPVAVGVAGAVVGAVAAGAAAVITLSDEKKRKQVQKTMKDVKDWGNKTAEDLRTRAQELKSTSTEKVDDLKNAINEKADSVTKAADEVTHESNAKEATSSTTHHVHA